MKLKARPDLHHAALPNGVYISSATGEFALSGWSGFADLMARCLPLLGEGSDEDALVSAIGTEKARPAVRQLLNQLDSHDMVLHLDSLTPGEPDAEKRSQHAELLAYLECRSTQPYAAFEQILSARILVVGSDEAVAVASSALKELGIEDTTGNEHRPHDVAVVLMRQEHVEQALPRAARFLPVVMGAQGTLVGPVVHDLRGWMQWRTLVNRTLEREGAALDREAATVVAASAAIHLLLQDLASVAGPDAYVVAGDTLEVHALDLPAETTYNHCEVSLSAATDTGYDADLSAWMTRLTNPWLGLARGLDEDELPQMPIALRRFTINDHHTVVAEGPDQHGAAGAATLAIARLTADTNAAGTSDLRWLLDGAFGHLMPHLNEGKPFTVEDPRSLRLLHAFKDGTATPELSAYTVPGITWVLIKCVLSNGTTTSGWGPTANDAALEALSRAIAVHQLPAQAPASLGQPGTAALRTVSTEIAEALAIEVTHWLAARSLRLVGYRYPADPILGSGPVRAGDVQLLPDTTKQTAFEEGVSRTRVVEALIDRSKADVVTTMGWDHDTLAQAVSAAKETGRSVVPLQLRPDAVIAGPIWSPTAGTGCPACAEIRRRIVLDHVLSTDLKISLTPTAPPPASLLELAATVLRSTPSMREGEIVVVSTEGVQRHNVLRHPTCPWCRPTPGSAAPAGLDLIDAQVSLEDPTRVAHGTPLLQREDLDAAVNDQYGPVRGILREKDVPFAMSMAVLTGGSDMGHGRALCFDQTRSVAVFEAYERFGGFPYEAPIVIDRTYLQVAKDAINPRRLGQYSEKQLSHPTSKVEPYHPGLPLDWAWGIDLGTGKPRLVPAEIGFYQYDHAFKRDLHGARAAVPAQRRRVFLESSSGCALGSSVADATIHALFEVAERDAFLLSWYRAVPLPRISTADFADPVIDALLALIHSRGFDVHLLRATHDIDIPVVWVLAVARNGTFPASFSSAGSGADPISAVRAGLREVAQLATMPLDWDQDDATQIFEDSWKVLELEDHVKWASAPEAVERVAAVLGGNEVSLAEAFPGWPEKLRPYDGNIVSTLQLVVDRFANAGLDEIVVVDQSTCEHRDQGIHVVKAVVPGTVPMVFGQAHQRLLGIPRLDAALRDLPHAPHPLDPHPFP